MVFKNDFYKFEKILDVFIYVFWVYEIKKNWGFFLCFLSRFVRFWKIDKKDLGKVLDGLIELYWFFK